MSCAAGGRIGTGAARHREGEARGVEVERPLGDHRLSAAQPERGVTERVLGVVVLAGEDRGPDPLRQVRVCVEVEREDRLISRKWTDRVGRRLGDVVEVSGTGFSHRRECASIRVVPDGLLLLRDRVDRQFLEGICGGRRVASGKRDPREGERQSRTPKARRAERWGRGMDVLRIRAWNRQFAPASVDQFLRRSRAAHRHPERPVPFLAASSTIGHEIPLVGHVQFDLMPDCTSSARFTNCAATGREESVILTNSPQTHVRLARPVAGGRTPRRGEPGPPTPVHPTTSSV